MDAFREPSPEEAKMVALQFLGQTQGFVKELDSHIISKTNTLRGNMLNIKDIVESLPNNARVSAQQHNPAPATQPQTHHYSAPQVVTQPNQLVDLLTKINSNIETVIKLLDK